MDVTDNNNDVILCPDCKRIVTQWSLPNKSRPYPLCIDCSIEREMKNHKLDMMGICQGCKKERGKLYGIATRGGIKTLCANCFGIFLWVLDHRNPNLWEEFEKVIREREEIKLE